MISGATWASPNRSFETVLDPPGDRTVDPSVEDIVLDRLRRWHLQAIGERPAS